MAFKMGKSMLTSLAEFYKMWLLHWLQEKPCVQVSRYSEMVCDIFLMVSKLILMSSSKYVAVLIICLTVKSISISLYEYCGKSLNAFNKLVPDEH